MTIKNQKVTAEQVKKVVTAEVPRIYVGPATKKLQRYTVYQNGLPKDLKEHFEKCPALEALFVPVAKLTETQKKLQDFASAESIFYENAKAYLEGVK